MKEASKSGAVDQQSQQGRAAKTGLLSLSLHLARSPAHSLSASRHSSGHRPLSAETGASQAVSSTSTSRRPSAWPHPQLLDHVTASPLFSAFSVGDTIRHHWHKYRADPVYLQNLPLMDTDRLLKIAQEYFEHEYAPYVGGVSLLVGAVVWFYATDVNRVIKVSLVSQRRTCFCFDLRFQHTAYRAGYQRKSGKAPIPGPLEDTRITRFMDGCVSNLTTVLSYKHT